MQQTVLWFGVTAAIALFFFAQALFWLSRSRRRQREERLKQRLRGGDVVEVGDGGGGIRIRSAGLRGEAAGRIVERLQLTIEQAGKTMSVSGLALRAGAAAVLALALVGLLSASAMLAVLAGLAAPLVVYWLLARSRDKRIAEMEKQLPTALETMVFSLRAGHSLEQAIGGAAGEVKDPLAAELARVYQETALGRPVELALQQLRDRWPQLRALRAFVEAIAVLKRTGGNLVSVMQIMTDNMRAMAAYEVRHKALTSEGRMSGRILMGMPIFALLAQAVTAPKQLQTLFTHPTGRLVLVAAAALWLLGVVWISRLTRPER